MPSLGQQLDLGRCPHCSVDRPSLNQHSSEFSTSSYSNTNQRRWRVYVCSRCGGTIIAGSNIHSNTVLEMYPSGTVVDDCIPDKAKSFLKQALETIHAPAGSIMLSASAIDAMLKNKGYTKGDLYPRIQKAAEDHLITEDMSKWAHHVRLDANEQRHADEIAELPSEDDARKATNFALAFAEFLFVLPSKVTRGLES